MRSNLIFTLIFIIFGNLMYSQKTSFWAFQPVKSKSAESWSIQPEKYKTLHLDITSLSATLFRIEEGRSITLPIPDQQGNFETYKIAKKSNFEKGLSDKFPGLQSFYGSNSQNSAEKIALSISPFGCHVMVIKENGEQYFIDPIHLNEPNENIVYYKKDLKNHVLKKFFCKMPDGEDWDNLKKDEPEKETETGERTGDCRLRTYRLALACTGEYANFHGGTIEKVLAAYNVAVTRLNLVYRKEIGIFMRLVDNTDQLIFLNASTDPYTNTNTSTMLGQNQTTVDNIIGRNNYDIGHVFGTGAGGIASLGSVCSGNRKAQGVTGRPSPVGDAFFIDYVAHEMGHQFRANHTQNNSCQRNNQTAMEPGSGSTIMGYAGICSPDVQNNSHDYFHAISLSEISSFILSQNNCGVVENLGNNRPELTIDKTNYTIPISTPFVLKANASDPDGDSITYTWEQMNNQTATMPPRATSTSGPMFRSIPPSTNPARYFPDLASKYGTWEVLPSVARSLTFRGTVRDNSDLGGCTEEVNVNIQTITSAGPFSVISPSLNNDIWQTGSPGAITWNVANTDKSPINCQLVDIYLSIDGGNTYPHLLAKNVPNTGSTEVLVPNLPTTRAKVMVKAADNLFFDTSNFPFTIKNIFEITYENKKQEICQTKAIFPFEIKSLDNNANHRISFELLEATTGITVTFPDTITQLPFSGQIEVFSNFTFDVGEVKVIFNVNNPPYQFKDTLYIYSNGPLENNQLILQKPVNGTSFPLETTSVLCSWNEVLYGKYLVQISTSPNFIDSLTSTFTLEKSELLFSTENALYFFRGKVLSDCGETPWSDTYIFSTDGKSKYNTPLLRNNYLIVNKNQQKNITKLNIDIDYEVDRLFSFSLLSVPSEGIITLRKSSGTDTLQIGDTFTLEDIYANNVLYIHQGGSSIDDYLALFIDNEAERSSPFILFINILQNNQFQAQAELISDIRCHGENGVVKLWVTGGTPPYRYKEFFSNQFIELPDDPIEIPAGQYFFIVTDALNNEYNVNRIALRQPPKLINQTSTMFYDLNIESSGGAGFSRMYSINGLLIDTSTFPNIPNGTYLTEVKDVNQCITYDTITVNILPLQADSIEYQDSLTCTDDETLVKFYISGGFEPYSVVINGIPFSTESFNLASGTYEAEIRDAGGKSILETIQIVSNEVLFTQITVDRRDVFWTTTGGIPPYEYSIDGVNFFAFDFLQDMSNGAYELTVRDAAGCLSGASFSVSVLDEVNIHFENILCFGDSVDVSVEALFGTPPFFFGLNKNQMDTSATFTDLSAGSYTIFVADGAGDSLEQTFILSQPDELILNFEVNADTMILLPEGGTPPYSFSADNGFTFISENTFTNVPKGVYTILVRDANGCMSETKVEIVFSPTRETETHSEPVAYPNPAVDLIYISIKGVYVSPEKIDFTNILGQKTHVPYVGNGQWDIRALRPGIYFMNIHQNHQTFRSSFIRL